MDDKTVQRTADEVGDDHEIEDHDEYELEKFESTNRNSVGSLK